MIELDFSKFSTENIKKIQHQNSEIVNSVFTYKNFGIIYIYVSLLKINEKFYVSPHKHILNFGFLLFLKMSQVQELQLFQYTEII